MRRSPFLVTAAAFCALLVILSGQACPPNTDQMMPAPMAVPPIGGLGVLVDDNTLLLDTNFTDGLYWKQGGNADTDVADDFLGTTDDRPLELRVNGARAMRLEPGENGPNVIGGFAANAVTEGIVGATIAGGGPADPNDTDNTSNRVTDDFCSIGGGAANQAGDGGDSADSTSARYATVGGGLTNTASGNRSTIAGGWLNVASGQRSFVGGGIQNEADGLSSTICGGEDNVASGNYSVIAGGNSHMAIGSQCAIGGGQGNTVNGNRSTVAGGLSNSALGVQSTVGGGTQNKAEAFYSTIPGGRDNEATESDTFAAGRRAHAIHAGAIVWGDSTNADVQSFGTNTFTVRASGGVRFYSSTDTTAPAPGAELPAGDSAWAAISDRNAKENFTAVNPREVLDRVAAMPIETWNYKAQDDGIRHIGPMAQDFHAAFNLGHDERRISTIDADGVALAAIKGLVERLDEKNAEIARQRQQIDDLTQRLERIETLVIKTP